MIETMDTLTGSPCYLCGEPILKQGWCLMEVLDDQWEVVCLLCELVCEDK